MSGSILFLVGSLGHWVLDQSRGPKSISLGIIGPFVWRILSGVASILWGVDFFLVWGCLHFVLQLSVVSHTPLPSIMKQRQIYGCLGFWRQWVIMCSRSILSPSRSLVAWWRTMGILKSFIKDPIRLGRTICWCIFLLFGLPSLNRRLCRLSDLWCRPH